MMSGLENLAFKIIINDTCMSLMYSWYVSPWKIMTNEIKLIDMKQRVNIQQCFSLINTMTLKDPSQLNSSLILIM